MGQQRQASPLDRESACPIDLARIVLAYEMELQADMWNPNEADRYYAFWRLFRACSLRAVLMQRGDDSFDNRYRISDLFIQMGNIMLDNESDGDRIVLTGDLSFAGQCARNAFLLMRDGDPWFASARREAAEKNLRQVVAIRSAIEADPDRFVILPRYGPFVLTGNLDASTISY